MADKETEQKEKALWHYCLTGDAKSVKEIVDKDGTMVNLKTPQVTTA